MAMHVKQESQMNSLISVNTLISRGSVYSLSEAAALLRVSRLTLLRAVHNGKLSAFRVGKQWRLFGEDLIRYIDLETGPNSKPSKA